LEIINRCNFRNNHIIHARLSSQQSLVKEDVPGQTNTVRQQDINAEVETKKTTSHSIEKEHTQQCSS